MQANNYSGQEILELKKEIETRFFCNGKLNQGALRTHENREFINTILSKLGFLKTQSIPQLLWHIFNDDYIIKECLANNQLKFISFYKGYRMICIDKDCLVCKETLKQFMRDSSTKIQNSKSDKQKAEIQTKREKTNIIKFGVDNPLKNSKIKNKLKETVKARDAKITIEINLKRLNTNLRRYGVDNPSKCLEIKEKISNTYHDKTHEKKTEINNKREKTNTEKYGVGFVLQDKTILDKVKSTSLKRYGEDNIFKTDTFKENVKNNNLVKYGVSNHTQIHLADVIDDLTSQKYWDTFTTKIDVYKKFSCYLSPTTLVNYGRKYRPELFPYNDVSYPHQIINNFLTELDIEFIINDRTQIKPLELDIFIPSHNLAIEINGLYWHSESQGKDKYYHLNKLNQCESKNIFLLQFNDQDIINKTDLVLSMIKSKLGFNNKIMARKTKVVDINNKTAKTFLDENHLQGYRASLIHKGLIYNNELVAVISLSKPRYNKQYDYEVIRYANKQGLNVIGGFSKLIKNSGVMGKLISYANRNISNGKLYESSGWFLENITQPSYYYLRNNKLFHRSTFQKHKLKDLLDNYNSDLSHNENMILNGYDKIFDCGTKVYSYIL